MLLMPESCTLSRNAASLNMALTRFWQSSKVPWIERLNTLSASTDVICRRWTSDVRPWGWRMKILARERPRMASIAALPVSPEVAPTMVIR